VLFVVFNIGLSLDYLLLDFWAEHSRMLQIDRRILLRFDLFRQEMLSFELHLHLIDEGTLRLFLLRWKCQGVPFLMEITRWLLYLHHWHPLCDHLLHGGHALGVRVGKRLDSI